MNPSVVLALSVVVYAAFPLLIALVPGPSRTLLLYAHLAAVLTLGSFLGSMYVLTVGGVELRAGQLAYVAYIFATLVTVVVGRDVRVVRHVIVLTAGVNTLAFVVLVIGQRALAGGRVADPFDVPPALFNDSLHVLVAGTALSILELLALLLLLEKAKKRLTASLMAPFYVLAFVTILLADGVVFPLLIEAPEPDLADALTNGIRAKAMLAGVFAVPLGVFVAAYRPVISRYEAVTLRLREVVLLSTDDLLADLDRQQEEIEEHRRRLVSSRTEAVRATATAAGLLEAARHTVIVVADERGRVLRCSSAVRQATGLAPEALAGRPLLSLLAPGEEARLAHQADIPEHLRHHPTALLDALARERLRHECLISGADGERRVVSLGLTELVSMGIPIGYLAAGEDVTEQSRARGAVRRALHREQEAVVRLREVERFQDELVSTVSHELRTPITSMTGYLEMVVDGAYGELPEHVRQALARVVRNTRRLERLVDDLLVVASDAGGGSPDLTELDLRDVLASVEEVLPAETGGHPARVVTDPGPEPVRVRGDAAALERLVLSLVSNAVKFTEDEGAVEVSTRPGDPGGPVAGRLVVRDTGVGIESDALPHLFRRFYRAPAAHDGAVPGTGLGLSIVEAVVTAHGGHVEVASAAGEGTTVTVLLPADPAVPVQRGSSGRSCSTRGG